ncbi:hypothetical protein I316_01554 [Kwoniella heveanensis BCC8398]|uniref:Uncharacterized protein n=1 Tax=Kwoniella heveanensis BCC8398 TaxID=1296120 RepID=A0A1B9H0Z9_9TREE|nr:hypothetical protein I316_01554 [Kwoniella heveanensis BCC8398]
MDTTPTVDFTSHADTPSDVATPSEDAPMTDYLPEDEATSNVDDHSSFGSEGTLGLAPTISTGKPHRKGDRMRRLLSHLDKSVEGAVDALGATIGPETWSEEPTDGQLTALDRYLQDVSRQLEAVSIKPSDLSPE